MKKYLKYVLIILFLIPFRVYAEDYNFEIDSKNAVLFNVNDNEIIYEKNKDEIIKVASMQKVLTSIVAIEKLDNLDDTFTITPGMFNSLDYDLAVVGLRAYDTVTYRDLLYGTLLRSGADCAYALGIAVSGSEEEYVKLMNEKAKELGLKNTTIENTTGLDSPNQHSTVYDMGILLKYALNNKKFKEIAMTPEYTILNKYNFGGPVKKAKQFGMDYFVAGKTGFTEEAGLCLVSYASSDGIDYILVTAGADYSKKDQNFQDQKTIYDFFINNYGYTTLINKGDKVTTIKTMYDQKIDIFAKKDIIQYMKKGVFKKDLEIVYSGKKVLDRSIKKGDKIGKYQIKYKNEILYEEDVFSPKRVVFIKKKKYKIAFVIIVTSIIIHLIIRSIKRKCKKRKRR